ncbi:hypothetical protein JCM9140_1973 [Halalkalibacter wakoensis JCM 9140]|uniref:Methionine aminopeptidase n=1 Tax=Halalkalibacter wakoensis JCM 9140 TaxID=1236970 RepID=W4Q1Z2_9BACI|nr:hypothetical protein [Halalkalibacter wakoensis]GAE25950.1 hypothetical protein JCM9140_1973 [Halalkalibacter wakoensis JCM 9140]
MGLLNVIGNWFDQRYEKRVEYSKEQGVCPECQGKGFSMHGSEMYMLNSYLDCGGCSGSGLYTDWVETNY